MWKRLAIALFASLPVACDRCSSISLTPRTTPAELRRFVQPRQHATVAANLARRSEAVLLAYRRQDWVEHALETRRLLAYAGALPTVMLETQASALVQRVQSDGVAPHLSFYVDLARRMRCAGSDEGLAAYALLAGAFARERGAGYDGQVVLLREGCSPSARLLAYGENVAWAVAGLVFSPVGSTLDRLGGLDLRTLLQLTELIAQCAQCEDAGGGSHSLPRVAADSDGDPAKACEELGHGTLGGMSSEQRDLTCDAVADTQGKGFAALNPSCAAVVDGDLPGKLPKRQDAFTRMARFDAFVACQSRVFDNQIDPRYQQLSQYFSGAQIHPKYGEMKSEEGGRTTWELCHYNCDGTSPGKVTTTVTESGNPDHVIESKTEYWQLDKGSLYEETTTVYEHGNSSTVETFKGGEDYYRRTEICDAGGSCSDIHEKSSKNADGKYETKVISEDEYENAKKHYQPRQTVGRPGPDDPGSACDGILDDTDDVKIRLQDIDELIQHDPYQETGGSLTELRQCLANFDAARSCHTHLLCVDEEAGLDCSCRSFSPGHLGPTNQCPLIQCAAGDQVVNCLCRNEGGGVIPGMRGPLVGPTPLPEGDRPFPPKL